MQEEEKGQFILVGLSSCRVLVFERGIQRKGGKEIGRGREKFRGGIVGGEGGGGEEEVVELVCEINFPAAIVKIHVEGKIAFIFCSNGSVFGN